jgi:hypothetical protein
VRHRVNHDGHRQEQPVILTALGRAPLFAAALIMDPMG